MISEMMRYSKAFVVPSLVLSLVSGCSTGNMLQTKPEDVVDPTAQMEQLKTQYSAAATNNYYAAPLADRGTLRNKIIYARLTAEDLSFYKFEWEVWGADAGVATLSDWIVLGLTGAGSVVSGGAANIFSAAAAGVTGAKTSLQKNFLYDKTLASLLVSMSINRAQIRAHIQGCLAQPDSQYDLNAALYDIVQYHEASILPSAIANLAASASTPSQWSRIGCNGVPARPDPRVAVLNSLATLSAADVPQLEKAMNAVNLTPKTAGDLTADQVQVLQWSQGANEESLTKFEQTLSPPAVAATNTRDDAMLTIAKLDSSKANKLQQLLTDMDLKPSTPPSFAADKERVLNSIATAADDKFATINQLISKDISE